MRSRGREREDGRGGKWVRDRRGGGVMGGKRICRSMLALISLSVTPLASQLE